MGLGFNGKAIKFTELLDDIFQMVDLVNFNFLIGFRLLD
jgi:hypothetical protein